MTRPFGIDPKTGHIVMEDEVAQYDGWIVRSGWSTVAVYPNALPGRCFPTLEQNRYGETRTHDFATMQRRNAHYTRAVESRRVGRRPLP